MLTDGTLYAIKVNNMSRPGYVLDTGNPTASRKDIRCRVYWRWPDCDNDWLNETPDLTDETCKSETNHVGTADVLCRWDVYCRNVKRERQQALDQRLALEQAHEAAKQAELDRLQAVAYLVPIAGYLDISDLQYLIGNDRGSDTRYSARHVLDLLEYITSITTRTPA